MLYSLFVDILILLAVVANFMNKHYCHGAEVTKLDNILLDIQYVMGHVVLMCSMLACLGLFERFVLKTVLMCPL